MSEREVNLLVGTMMGKPAAPRLEVSLSATIDRLTEQDPPSPYPDDMPPRASTSGERDFRSTAMRRAEEALDEIRTSVSELLADIQEHRDAGDWAIEPTEVKDYKYRVNMIDGLLGRLRNPYYGGR